MSLLYALMLGVAVSLDSFAAGLAYGAKNIEIPLKSLAVIGAVTAVSVAVAMLAAVLCGQVVDLHAAVLTGSLLLIGLGVFNLFQEYLTKDIKAYEIDGGISPQKITFSVGKLVISIMAKPETADVDRSKSISAFEAIFLGLALGLDNAVATFAAGLMGLLPLYTPLLMGAAQMAFIACGCWAATCLPLASLKSRFPFFPGVLLILIGILRLR